MGGAIIVRRLQGDDDITVVGQGQSSFRNRGPGNVAAQALKLPTLMRLAGNRCVGPTSMQGKPRLLADQIVAFTRFSSDGNCL
jgi:hypothetical protein